MTTVQIGYRGNQETVTVSRVKLSKNEFSDDPPDLVLEGLDPSETDLLSPDLVWFSGSLGHPHDHDYQKFPCVHVPVDSEYDITVLE